MVLVNDLLSFAQPQAKCKCQNHFTLKGGWFGKYFIAGEKRIGSRAAGLKAFAAGLATVKRHVVSY